MDANANLSSPKKNENMKLSRKGRINLVIAGNKIQSKPTTNCTYSAIVDLLATDEYRKKR